MAFSDWKITKYNGNTANGTAVLHSGLSNPASGAGTFCRGFNADPNNLSRERMNFSVSDSYGGGSLTGITSSKSISLRAMIRPGAAFTNAYIALYCKAKDSAVWNNHGEISTNRSEGGAFPSASASGPGYFLVSVDSSDGNFQQRSQWLCLVCGGYYSGNLDKAILSKLNNDQWYTIRMDVIPVTQQVLVDGYFVTQPYKDVIDVYTGAGAVGSETWTKIYTKELLTTDQGYVPWGNFINTGLNGAQAGPVTSSVGFIVDYPVSAGYIDRFEVRTENV